MATNNELIQNILNSLKSIEKSLDNVSVFACNKTKTTVNGVAKNYLDNVDQDLIELSEYLSEIM